MPSAINPNSKVRAAAAPDLAVKPSNAAQGNVASKPSLSNAVATADAGPGMALPSKAAMDVGSAARSLPNNAAVDAAKKSKGWWSDWWSSLWSK